MVFRRIWLLGIMAWFAEPVIYLVAMGLGLGKYLERVQGVQYIEFIAPGLLAVSTMFGATFSVTWDAWFKMERVGVYHAAISTPLSVEDVALGEILWGATRATIYGSAFMVVATAFGVFRSWWGLLTLPAIALVGVVFAITGLIYTYCDQTRRLPRVLLDALHHADVHVRRRVLPSRAHAGLGASHRMVHAAVPRCELDAVADDAG